MKQCVRCGNNAENNEKFCQKCGGTNFKPVMAEVKKVNKVQQSSNTNNKAVKPNDINKSTKTNVVNKTNNEKNTNNVKKETKNSSSVTKLNNNDNKLTNSETKTKNSQNKVSKNSNSDISDIKLTKKQLQAKDLATMNAMRQAQNSGKKFNIEEFEKQWIIDNVINKSSSASPDEIDLKQWIITLVLTIIPVLGIVYSVLIIRDNKYSSTRRNFHKAFIILYCASFVISVIVSFIIVKLQ